LPKFTKDEVIIELKMQINKQGK